MRGVVIVCVVLGLALAAGLGVSAPDAPDGFALSQRCPPSFEQTVAGTWVITTPNPEERGWETQLAEFDMSATLESTPAGEAPFRNLWVASLGSAIRRQPQQQPDSHLRTTYGLGTDRAQRKSPPPPKEIGKNTL